MTHFPAHTASRIRNRSMGVLHLIAADERCEVSDILALITPSQPEAPSKPHAPAADTAATQAAGDTTDGEVVPPPSTSPSVEPIHQWSVAPGSVIPAPFYLDTDTIPEAPKPLPDDQEMHRPAEAKTSEQADGGAVSAVKGSARLENADGVEPPPSEPIKKPTRRDTLRALVAEHPDWTAKDFAAEMGISDVNVRTTASHIGLKLPKASTKAERAKAATTEALKAAPAKPQEIIERVGPPTPRPEPKQPPAATAEDCDDFDKRLIALHKAEPTLIRPQLAEVMGVKRGQINAAVARLGLTVPHARASNDEPFVPEVIPPATPQVPVGADPKATTTLTERVRNLHRQHPNWTATMLAHELGAKPTSVSTILSMVRGKPAAPVEQPQFSGRREMVEHYGAIAKRLGKS